MLKNGDHIFVEPKRDVLKLLILKLSTITTDK